MKRNDKGRVAWGLTQMLDFARDKAAINDLHGWRKASINGKPALFPIGQEPPPLVLDCPLRGNYAITFRVGVPDGGKSEMPGTLRVESDDAPGPLTIPLRGEFYAGVWRLRGAPIVIRKINSGRIGFCGITFEKHHGATPFFPKVRSDREPTIWGIFDQNDVNVELASDDVQHVAPVIRYHRELGFNVISWNMYAGTCEYPTRVGTRTPFINLNDKEHLRLLSENRIPPYPSLVWRNFTNRYDIMKEGIRLAHQEGMKFFPCMRINNEWGAPWCEEEFGTREFLRAFWQPEFFRQHPEYWIQLKDGSFYGGGMDFSHAAVRRYRLAIVTEVMENYPELDGIFIDTHRHPPMVSYPDRVVTAFKKKYGIDVRRLEPINEHVTDPRWHKFRARHFTDFMRGVRKAKEKLGRHYPTVVRTAKTFAQCLQEGADLEVWFAERLVDTLILEDHRTGSYETFLQPVIDAAKAAGVSVLGGFQSPSFVEQSPWNDVRGIAEQWLREGARGVAFYESNQLVCGSHSEGTCRNGPPH